MLKTAFHIIDDIVQIIDSHFKAHKILTAFGLSRVLVKADNIGAITIKKFGYSLHNACAVLAFNQ